MSKYVIELRPDCKVVQQICESDGQVGIGAKSINYLEELNSDYINEHYGDLQDTAYQRGLNDAWEAARKISVIELNGGLTGKELMKIYGTMDIHKIYDDNTASEAIEKLKAYEEKQKADDEIKVGDEVRHDRGWTAVVTSIDNVGFSVMDYNGEVASYSDIGKFKKTGRHFDIQSILEEMRHD